MHYSQQLEALLHNPFYGNYGVRLAAIAGFAFLLGSIPVGAVVRWCFADLGGRWRRAGTATIAPLNVAKGFVPVAIAVHGGGLWVGALCASVAILGHAFCPWRRFAGGTGTDALLGAVLAFNPFAALVFAAFWCAAALPLRSRDAGSLFAAAMTFFPLWFFAGPAGGAFGIAAAAIVAARLAGGGEAFEPGEVENLDRAATTRSDHPALL